MKMDIHDGGVGVWTGSIWLRAGTDGGYLTATMNLRVPKNARNFLEPVSFSRRSLFH